MLGELIRDAEPPDGNADNPLLREEFENGAAEASHQGVLLDGDDPLELLAPRRRGAPRRGASRTGR